MNAERIERLAIDRALGELNEDATVLFDAYLAEHPQAQVWAQAMSDVCARTHRAIDKKTQYGSAGDRAPRVHSFRPTRIQWGRVGRWAAVVAVCLGLGVTAGRWSRPQAPPRADAVVRADSAPSGSDGWRHVLSGQERGFWQSKALAALRSQPYEGADPRERQMGFWDRFRPSRQEGVQL